MPPFIIFYKRALHGPRNMLYSIIGNIMRELGPILTRNRYSGTYSCKYQKGKTMLSNIFDENHIQLCDHIWVKTGKWNKNIAPGSVFSFTAIPIKYVKANVHTTNKLEVDVTLTDIRDVKVTGWSLMESKLEK